MLILNIIIKYYDIKLLDKDLTDIFFLHLFPMFVVKGKHCLIGRLYKDLTKDHVTLKTRLQSA